MTIKSELAALPSSLHHYVYGGFCGYWIHTLEIEAAIAEMLVYANRFKHSLHTWDIAKGIVNPMVPGEPLDLKTRSPLAPLTYPKPTGADKHFICLWNFHLFLKQPEVMQAFYNAVIEGPKTNTYYLIMTCMIDIPKEIEKILVLSYHKLPNDNDIKKIANAILGVPKTNDVANELINASRGLTRREAENAFAYSIAKHGHFEAQTLIEYKSESIKKSGFLEFYEGPANFKNLCGLTQLKWFSSQLLKPDNKLMPKGLILLGPPGTGKSQFAKALGMEVNRPVILCDLSRIYSKHVGETEANLRDVINISESIGPCILFIDEIEKALGGVNSDGDSGVSKRVFGKLLTWLSDKTSDVFVVGTCNNVVSLPAEFTRAGRFDGLFFIDLPDKEEREKLWSYYCEKYGVVKEIDIEDAGWTGAEIEECCKKSLQLNILLKEAAKYIIPVSISRREDIERLREWSKARCMSANYPGRYIGATCQNLNLTESLTRKPVKIEEKY